MILCKEEADTLTTKSNNPKPTIASTKHMQDQNDLNSLARSLAISQSSE